MSKHIVFYSLLFLMACGEKNTARPGGASAGSGKSATKPTTKDPITTTPTETPEEKKSKKPAPGSTPATTTTHPAATTSAAQDPHTPTAPDATVIEPPPPESTSTGQGAGVGTVVLGGIEDFLVQNVCASDADENKILAADPYPNCPGGYHSRDLRVGELLPYHKTDQAAPGHPDGFQGGDSFPIRFQGQVRQIHQFDFGVFDDPISTAGGSTARFEHNFYPGAKHRDGSDTSENSGAFASFPATTDTNGEQPFWGPNCAREDGWVLFSNDLTKGQTARNVLATITGGATCAPGQAMGQALTYFDYPDGPFEYSAFYTDGEGKLRYDGGAAHGAKTLETVISWHFGGATIDTSTHIEKFYFTRTYGKTRWERWQNIAMTNLECGGHQCTEADSDKGNACNGPSRDERSPTAIFVRISCRDWTQIRPNPWGGYDPYSTVGPIGYLDSNLLDNGDFGKGLADLGPWQRPDETGTNWSLVADPAEDQMRHGNHTLVLSAPQGPAVPASVFQDVALPADYVAANAASEVAFRFGARLADAIGGGTAQNATVAIFTYDANGTRVGGDVQRPVVVPAGGSVRLRERFLAPLGTARIRFQVYVNCGTGCGQTALDDAYVTRE